MLPEALPVFPIRLKKEGEESLRAGMPWVYTSDIIESSEMMLAPSGSVVSIETPKGQRLGTGYYNGKSQIACRILTLSKEPIDTSFFMRRLEKALALRDKLIGVPYYRLVHSEADHLPGLLIDRFGNTLVVQVGTAGMELLQPFWMEALENLIKPKAILLRNDVSSRILEGLNKHVTIIKGEINPLTEVIENGTTYLADLLHGQKTGWFYDQRDNRKMIADLAKDKTVIDIYSHSGGFGIIAAANGAKEVTMVDSSALALELAAKAAARNNVHCASIQGDAFEVMQRLATEGKYYDIVLADPPAFVKTKKDIASGMKGYEKVSRMAAALVAPGGLLFVASCSHHAARNAFNKSVESGIKKAGRASTILKQTGAAPDHPRHPALPQNEYLKGILLKITE